jgi:hypothetical protein
MNTFTPFAKSDVPLKGLTDRMANGIALHGMATTLQSNIVSRASQFDVGSDPKAQAAFSTFIDSIRQPLAAATQPVNPEAGASRPVVKAGVAHHAARKPGGLTPT